MNLAISTVKRLDKPDRGVSRRHRFDVLSADRFNGTLCLQAGSEQERTAWVSALRSAIAASLRRPSVRETRSRTMSVDEFDESQRCRNLRKRLKELSPKCADCGEYAPEWLCCNMGVLVCIKCSGVHRSLGVSVSKVRSLEMDDVSELWLRVAVALGGNNCINTQILESSLQRGWSKPSATATREIRSKYITAKYRWRGFVKVDASKTQKDVDAELTERVNSGDVLGTMRCIAQGANVADIEFPSSNDTVKDSTTITAYRICVELARLNKQNAVGPAALM